MFSLLFVSFPFLFSFIDHMHAMHILIMILIIIIINRKSFNVKKILMSKLRFLNCILECKIIEMYEKHIERDCETFIYKFLSSNQSIIIRIYIYLVLNVLFLIIMFLFSLVHCEALQIIIIKKKNRINKICYGFNYDLV